MISFWFESILLNNVKTKFKKKWHIEKKFKIKQKMHF